MNFPFFKKSKQNIVEKLFDKETLREVDIIAPASIKVEQSRLQIGERYAKTFFIFSYPRYLNSGWLSPIINLDVPMDVSFFIHPIASGVVLKQLRKRLTEIQAELMDREERGLIRDPTLETAMNDIENLRDQLQTAQERMFKFGLYITVYSDDEKELLDTETELRSILESRLIYIKPALYQQKQGFISTSPYGLDELGVHNTINTEPLSSIFPFISFDLSSNEGILYGINKHNNSLVLFDRFSLENSNFTIFAKSGAGKSIHSSESVLIKNKGEICLTKIGPLVEKLIKKQGITQIDKELEGVIDPNIEVYSFDKNLQAKWSKATVAARKQAPTYFYKFRTQSGREIVTTEDHNMLILKQGKISAVKSSEIKEGEFIPLPRQISESKNQIKSLNLLELLKNTKTIYVKGCANLIQKHYYELKNNKIDSKYDKYLYRYRNGQLMPIKYFWQIKKKLGINIEKELPCLSLCSHSGKGEIPAQFPLTNEFLKILGYIASEGTISKKYVIISNLDKEVIKDIESALKKLKILYFKKEKSINIATSVFVETINALGGDGKSHQKQICPFIFNSEKEKIAQYLSAYFEGDGGVEKHQITAVSKSKKLISEICYLFFYFGIIGRISQTRKKPTNSDWKRKKVYYKLSISGQDNLKKFAENINFVSNKKQKALSKIIGKQGNTNVDIIPDVYSIFKEIYELLPSQLHRIQDISNIKRQHYNPSPQKIKKMINIIEQRIEYFKDLSATFNTLRELPELNTIINLGKNNKEFNRKLWQCLGNSWHTIKKYGVTPRSLHALKMIEVINGNSYYLEEIKSALYTGFQEMDLPIKYYNPSVQQALKAYPKSNTSYEIIQQAAQFVCQNYQNILSEKIPQVEKKLSQLKMLANSSLFWDPIVKIKKFENKKEKYVYDLTVDNEVFLAGQGGMFIHNSFLVKVEALRSLMLGTDVIVLDPENEYKSLAESVGGAFFSISLSSPHHINPFDLPMPREDERPEDVLRSNIINLVGLFRIMFGGLTPEEDAIMDRAISETYAAKDISADTDPKLWSENFPLMQDLEAVLETMDGAESLVRRTRKFTKGTFAEFFNQPSNISTKNRFVVFGIRDMEDELRPIAMFMVMRYIWNSIRAEVKKRLLVVDEAWWIMQSEDGASFLFGICKRARKYWLGVTTITQDVADFMKSPYGKPIITNSSLHLLMKQSPATIDIVQKTFNLTDEEKYMLLEAAVGEGLFFAGMKHVAIRVVASYAEEQIITTNPEELQKIKMAKEQM